MPLQGDWPAARQAPLPYQLTGAQRRVIGEIEGDMAQSAPMLRLLQGDVGSGKTLVALMAMLAAVEAARRRRCWRRPRSSPASITRRCSRQLAGLPVNVAILTGREKGRAREAS